MNKFMINILSKICLNFSNIKYYTIYFLIIIQKYILKNKNYRL